MKKQWNLKYDKNFSNSNKRSFLKLANTLSLMTGLVITTSEKMHLLATNWKNSVKYFKKWFFYYFNLLKLHLNQIGNQINTSCHNSAVPDLIWNNNYEILNNVKNRCLHCKRAPLNAGKLRGMTSLTTHVCWTLGVVGHETWVVPTNKLLHRILGNKN